MVADLSALNVSSFSAQDCSTILTCNAAAVWIFNFFLFVVFFWRWGGGGVSLPPVKTNLFLCSPPPELVHCANTVFGLHTAPGLQVRIVLFVFAFSGNKCVQARTATYKVPR